ncbi:hypothetical protein WME76_24720 [Sorangium sp. So ce119]|uniref:hypothetical protein n=1 Tax=Sorangium sp. So ce119 TaxID=3133279 RepID=UPI003F63E46C
MVVHIILGVALWMAWLEFDNARKTRAKVAPLKGAAAKGKGKPEPDDEAAHELKLGLDGIAFKSSLQGTAILALALAFYALYLKFVYPIVLLP